MIQKFPFKTQVSIRWSDLDEFGVVNNAVFMTYFEQARVNLFAQFVGWDWKSIGVVVAHVDMAFKSPIRNHNQPEIYIRCTKIGTTSYTLHCLMVESTNIETVFSEASFVMVCYDFNQASPVAVPEVVKQHLENLR
jgi:acyl-CoA thioester hydrolase